MKKLNREPFGFTLVELMVVIAIVGTLAAIAVPRFADLMRKAREGSTKGNLGVLRSCIRIYYARNEGEFPSNLAGLTTQYIEELPLTRIGAYGHPDKTDEMTATNDIDADTGGGWVYPDSSSSDFGKVWVNCTHKDTKQEIISTW
ncbi:MAG: type II secretion system protein [Elusimicrobiota bacterium]